MIYARADETVPEPCQVAGTPLRPFCLGHHLLFRRLGLPFANAPMAEAARDAIIIGIVVCAARFEDTLEAFLSGDWPRVMARWRKRVAGPWWKPRKVDWAEAEMLFRAYLQDGYKRPPVLRHETAGGVFLTAPWEVLLKVRLVMAGFNEMEVLNGYLPGRWYDYFTALELDAAAKLKDPKHWRKVFHTQEAAEKMEAANG
jgi:hypothetical protein